MTRKLFGLILVVLALFTVGSFFMYYVRLGQRDRKQAAAAQKNGDYYKRLDAYGDFVALQGLPLSDKFNDVQSVKIVYERRTGRLYFINSSKYRYHYEFCRQVLGDEVPLEAFNTLNYGRLSQRDYLLANLNYYVSSHQYAVEFSSEDEISPEQIALLFREIGRQSYLADSLQLLISSGNLLTLDSEGKLRMPKLYVSDVYKNQQYQELNAGVAYGVLRKIEDLPAAYASVRPDDIIIIKGTPVNVPVCAGIITDMYQTPLSHINILCHNRNIPSAVDIGIWHNSTIDTYVGKPVHFTVNGDKVLIVPTTAAALATFRQQQPPPAKIRLHADLRAAHLIPLAEIRLNKKDIVGNKAAGLGELSRIADRHNHSFLVPEGGFAIPFGCYRQHVAHPAIQREIDELLDNPRYTQDAEAAAAQLKKIRKAIKEQPLDPALLAEVQQMILKNDVGKSYRFRSSSNAEDAKGFSAAGLYDSKTGILDDTDKSVEKAIRAVWASTWSEEAYRERLWAGIDQHTIMMGILAHRNFPDESANGVAITRNLYRDGFPGFTINVQAGELSVVSPPDSVTCEQFLCMRGSEVNPASKDITVDYLTYSNINQGKPVLSRDQIGQLYRALEQVKTFYYWNLSGKNEGSYADFALDIEFKFDRNGKLYLKQARPYR